MAGLDDLLQENTQNLGGTDLQFTDADTLAGPDGTKYRLQGVGSPETYHPGVEGTGYEAGSAESTLQISKLANDFGYNNIVEVGEDPFGRKLVDLQDAQGRSFKRKLAESGVAEVQGQYDPQSTLGDAQGYGEFLRTSDKYEADEWDKAAAAVKSAVDEETIYNDQFYTRTQYDRTDVDKNGNALSPLSTAWDTGMLGVSEAMYGVASLIGDTFGFEEFKQYGEIGSQGKRYQIGDQGKILTDYKDVDGFGTAVEYVANNAILSLPYMGITAAATIAAPFTGGASLLAPASVYTGQAWNEMGEQIKDGGERSAGIAIATGVAQATLDRLGLAGIIGSGTPKKLLNDAVEELVKQGATREAAKATVMQASKRELASLAGNVGDIAKQQLGAKKVAMGLLGRAGKGAGTEGVTEALQESIAAIGADLGSGQPIDWLDVQDRAIQGAVAGSALGGSFSVPGAALDAGQWANIAWGVDRADPEAISNSTRYAQEEEATHGYVPSIQELVTEVRERGTEPVMALNDRAEQHKQKQKERNSKDLVVDAMTGLPSLWRGATRWIFNPELQAQSRSARILADMFGGNLQRIFSGSGYENAKHHKVAVYKNMVDIPHNVYLELNEGKTVTRRDKVRLSSDFYTNVQGSIDAEGNFNPDAIPDGPKKATYVKLAKQLLAMGDKMHSDQAKYNTDLGYQKNYLLRFKALDKYQVQKNRSDFINKIKKHYGLDEATAASLVDNILDSESATVDEAFSVVKGGPSPGSHKARTFNLSENPEFQQFMEKDLFSNISQAARTAARYTANQEFIGDNASTVSKLLEDMIREGVPEAEVNKVAAQMKNYLDAESGNYHRPDTELGKSLQKIQKNFMLFTTMAGLPLATISSFVEAALTMRGLTRDQIYGKDKGLAALGKELASTLNRGMGAVADAGKTTVGTKGNRIEQKTAGQQALRNLGYYEWDVGAATTTGVTETHTWHQNILEKYFKWTGLQGWTNYTRAVRASVAGDYITDNLAIIRGSDPNQPLTNEVREAQDKLRNLGLDVSLSGIQRMDAVLSGQADPETEQQVADLIREANFNFINEAVALPQSGNRPLIYQDPRFALFTQFQGFIATFTANHIPRLWGEYIKRGSPAMRYNTFALMSTMIVLGFASQYLKDLLKYGTTENPYLDTPELLQRGVRASGLLGTGERVLDQFFPIYETRSKDAGEWVFNTATGESPALANLKRLLGAGGAAIQGEGERAIYQGLKSTPISGPFTAINREIAKRLSSWDYNGG